jgi:uncharacterized protein (DUF2141 family)
MIRSLLLAAVALSLSAPAAAQKANPFSADMVMTPKAQKAAPMTMKIYSSGAKFRMDTPGGAVITDTATKKSVMLMPAQKMFMDLPAGDDKGPKPVSGNTPCAGDKTLTCKDLGTEKIDGRETHKWQVTQANGSSSTVWLDSKIGFPLKFDSAEASSELKNVKEGAQPADLFEIPKDFKPMSMGGFPGMPPMPPPGH